MFRTGFGDRYAQKAKPVFVFTPENYNRKNDYFETRVSKMPAPATRSYSFIYSISHLFVTQIPPSYALFPKKVNKTLVINQLIFDDSL